MTKAAPAPPPAVLQPQVPEQLMQKVADAAAGRPLNVTADELKQLSHAGNEYVMAQLGRQALLEQESIARHERLKAWNALSCQERTQRLADQQWPAGPGTRRFAVGVEGHPPSHQVTVELNAHSEYEAVGCYSQLCGIISLDANQRYAVKEVQSAAAEGPPVAPAADAPPAAGPGDRPPEGEMSAAPQGGKVRKLS
jgi:hypothetical protein